MANPNETELLPPSGAVTRGPALGSPELSTEYLARIKENLEVLLGRRGGSDWDRAVTFRDLHGMGWQSGAGGGGMVFNMAGMAELDANAPGFQQFVGRLSDEIMRSAAFKSLKTRIGSAESNAHLPDEIKRQLQLSLLQVAREHQAAIETVENKIQTSTLSMASRLKEITASLERTAAGVREFDVAYADRTQAIALKVTQLAASLEGVGSVELEERFQAIADEIDGLQGQWSIKIQANGSNGIPVIAGIALAVESPTAGPGTSSLIFMAERFGFVTQNGTTTPFVIVDDQIEFTGNVRINGQLVIGPTGLQPGFEAPDTKNSEQEWSDVQGRPYDVSNLVKKGTFEDNSKGTWNALAAEPATHEGSPYSAQITTRSRDVTESGNLFAVTPGERLYFSAWLETLNTVYPSAFGVVFRNKSGAVVSFAPACSRPALNPWALINGELTVPANAVTAQPWLQQNGFDFANGNWLHANGLWIGRHARGATVGAPVNTPVGNHLAQDMETLAGATAKADAAQAAAQAAATLGLAEKLSKTGNEEIHGQKSLMSQYALLVGTVNDGIIYGSTGLYGRKGGQTTVSIGADGTAIFLGQLIAAWGTFGAVSIAPGGKLTVGAASNFGDEGVFLGYVGNVVKFSIVSGATKLLYDPTSPTPLQIIGPAITGANLNAYTASISGGTLSGEGANGFRSYGSRTASVSGNFKAPLSYSWRIASRYSNDTTVLTLSNDSTATVTVSGTGYDEAVHCVIVCNITDDNGLSRSVGFDLVQQHGTPP